MKKIKTFSNFVNEAEEEDDKSALQKEYAKYFMKILKKYDVETPAELDEDKKKKFFDEIKSGWEKGTGEKE